MPAQDTSEIKGKILSFLRRNGPSLPVHIAREIESSTLFTSAFLSELASEKKLKISNMRVGNSPLYFLQRQEPLLEKFSEHLKSKEEEAFILLKEKRFLQDSEQNPAIRVALREIKDFASPFQKDGKIIWRFHTIPEEEFKFGEERPKVEIKREEEKEKTLDIFNKSGKIRTRKISRKKNPKKENKFFDDVRNFLTSRSFEMTDIESFGKNEIILKIKEKGQDKLLIAYNKKRIGENDIIRASKKASDFGLPYVIISKGEPLKKVNSLLEALGNLSSIEKIK